MTPEDIKSIADLLIAAVTGAGAVAAAASIAWAKAVKPRLTRIEDHAAEARGQVANSHNTNLREENDERHEELVKEFRFTQEAVHAITSVLENYRQQFRGLQQDVTRMADAHSTMQLDMRQLAAVDRETREDMREHRKELRTISERLEDHIRIATPALEATTDAVTIAKDAAKVAREAIALAKKTEE